MNSAKAHVRSLLSLAALPLLFACSSAPESGDTAISQLSTPSFSISGTGAAVASPTNYIFANSAGNIDTSTNLVTASFSDPYLPLSLGSSQAYYDQMSTGSCTQLGSLLSYVAGGSGNQITTQLSAIGCSDQAEISVALDTTQVFDDDGYDGSSTATFTLTVDVAPKVTAIATGNTNSDGSGTNYVTSGQFSIANDNSIVVTFSKSLVNGTFTAALTGCGATLGTPTLVTGSSGQTIAWPLTGFSGFSTGTQCQLSVSTIADALGNPEDLGDANLNMTVTFEP